jgi:undecaprenyl-diphosphatase
MGVLQGVTEFLPVSSSGHLALMEQAFGVEPRLYLATALHLGTLAVIVYHFRKEIGGIVAELSTLPTRARDAESAADLLRKNEGLRLAFYVVLASVPTGVVGLGIGRIWHGMASSLVVVSAMFLITAALLVITHYLAREPTGRVGVWTAVGVGVAQGLAAAPGISRSGTTIGVALLLGVARPEAARFSFLCSIPAIVGATILEADSLSQLSRARLPGVVAGTVAAGAVGYFALVALLRFVREGRLHWFACYLVPLGVFGIVWSLIH